MNQLKNAWEVIKAFFKTERQLAEEYLAQAESQFEQFDYMAALKDPKITLLTPATRRRLRNARDNKQRKKGERK